MYSLPLRGLLYLGIICICFGINIPAYANTISPFGINHIGNSQGLAQEVGFDIDRVNVIWKNLQQHPRANFEPFTKQYLHDLLDRNTSHGIASILLIEQPPASICQSSCPKVEDLALYEDFLSRVLLTYKDKIIGIEIYNEPDREVHFPPKPDPAYYVSLLKTTKVIRDRISPSVKIIMGGHSGPPNTKLGYTFLYDIYQHGVQGYYDIFNYHHYTQNENPDEGWGHPAYWYTLFDDFFKVHDPDMKIWVTETGYATDGNNPEEIVSESKQAENIIKIYNELLRLPRIEKVFLFELQDSLDNPLKYGIYDQNLRPKMSKKSIQNFIRTFDEKQFLETRSYTNPFVRHHIFGNETSKLHTLWLQNKYVYPKPGKRNTQTSELISFIPDLLEVEFFDINWKRFEPKIFEDYFSINITNSPLFILEKKKIFNQAAMDFVQQVGITQGYEDGLFHPERNLLRSELLKISINAFETLPQDSLHTIPFPDIPQDHWVIPYAHFAKINTLIKGAPDGNFYPHKKVTRFEALKILINTAHLPLLDQSIPFENISKDHVFFPYVSTAYHAGLISHNDFFSGNEFLYRGEMAEWVWELK